MNNVNLDFEHFFDHSEPVIRDAAELLSQARDKLQANQITKQQFKELANDIVEVERMVELAESVEQMTTIRRAANDLLSIISKLA